MAVAKALCHRRDQIVLSTDISISISIINIIIVIIISTSIV